jgi:hypothetical protein
MSGAKPVDREVYDQLVTWGHRLKYKWRRCGIDRYELVRPDSSVAIFFGPVHPSDVAYFNSLCSEDVS